MAFVQQPNFYHVGINYIKIVDMDAVQKAIEAEAIDWMRYAFNCYLIWTRSEPAVISGRLMAVPGMSPNNFLILKCDLVGFGWLPDWIWEWLNRDRSQLALLTAPPITSLPPR